MSILNRVDCSPFRLFCTLAILIAGLFIAGCGSSGSGEGHSAQYPAGISDDIAKLLKYDARVQSFSEDGATLDVEVNDEWMTMPQGMQERAMGHWFSVWKSAHGDKARVVVRYDGNEVSSYTTDKGFQPTAKPKEEESA